MGMEVLSALLRRAVEGGCITGCRMQRAASGLRINLAKSEIIPVGEVDEILEMAVELGCKVGQLPSTYLGLPLGAPNKAGYVWDGVEERMRWKLALWKRQYLSKGGRITLIKSTLASMPLYQLSLFRMPKGVARRLEKLQRDFLWGGGSTERKAHLVSWEKVCVSKEKGGLGLRKIVQLNKALLGNGSRDLLVLRMKCGKRHQNQVLEGHLVRGCGAGPEIPSTLQCGCPKKCHCGGLMGPECWPRNQRINLEEDLAVWKGGKNGKFGVKDAYGLLTSHSTSLFPKKGIWVENVPSKLAFFAWEATWGRILTIDRLQKRGWQILNRCYLCGSDEENVSHLLIHCTVASVLWGMALSMFGAQWVFPETVKEVRMITGDNLQTAKAIALECGILPSEADATEPNIIEGRAFRVLSEREREQVAKKILVMGRSSPNDKLLLVQALRKAGEVVAVTGDGTNDAPALHEADIGLSMGIQGTEVAKESSDIIILDDNFASVVKVSVSKPFMLPYA
ncbi:Calcium-transporting ATPase 9, plasma membrane-type [Vitis vinifera]|uniref:Calcium-transporting ATPase 9, plasma membrane-type n=1 Tax=Vitis vinifera TaxID=29760 RepID=A0A438HGX2_VITVI|nr:Calcium-transporting ATPase 9, plasma membrane-type [Vitis vinifera]